jgi:hypothetical protein
MTSTYKAPLRDMRFVMDEWLDAASWWREVPGWQDLDSQTSQQVLEEAARFVKARIAPLNASADLEGCRFDAGSVERTTRTIKTRHAQDPETACRVADDYLAMLGWMLLAFAWARTLRIALPHGNTEPFYVEKYATGRFFFDYPLAAFTYRRELIEAGCEAALPLA